MTYLASTRLHLCPQLNSRTEPAHLDTWIAAAQICENYYPAKGHTQGCSPGAMTFYHWGALSGFISLQEAGYY